MEKIGLISGKGKLPQVWCREAQKQGYQVVSFSLIEEPPQEMEEMVEKSISVNIGKLGRLLELIEKEGIDKVILLGKVEKKQLFENFQPDRTMKQLLTGLDDLNDESILKGVAGELEAHGIEILKQSTFLENLLAPSGLLTREEPRAEIREDMRYGFNMAREIGKLDIGQTVIVKNKAVVAVEAVEGTDAAIKRGGRLAQKGIVMAKVSKPGQDLRFDIPTIGPETIKNLEQAQAAGLVVEAGKTFLLEKENILKRAQANDISVLAVKAEGNPHG